ncbi:hypothetical protein [Macrococcus brunensis]|uniref:hypothetical protein n=1 Tax=Macrococcus brunensis TaxID=198483 RepID=UPI001EF11DD2|nr:hypothetical protein [Macrococcus brunensis]ULG74714.1 hypothetical protein MGG13_02810 [Macrococcus brunensis]
MIVSVIQQGEGLMNEDALIINDQARVYGVIDGVTSLSGRMFAGVTPGKRAADAVKAAFEQAESDASLNDITETANQAIQTDMTAMELEINHPKDRFQCCHAAVKLLSDHIEWTSSADCVLYAIGDEVIQAVPRYGKKEESDRMAEWMKKYPNMKDRPKEMIEAMDQAKKMANQPFGYSVMNGDLLFNEAYNHGTLSYECLTHILLTTDGFYDIKGVGLEQFVREGIRDLDQFLRNMMLYEIEDKDKRLYPRYKVHDDKAALLITL